LLEGGTVNECAASDDRQECEILVVIYLDGFRTSQLKSPDYDLFAFVDLASPLGNRSEITARQDSLVDIKETNIAWGKGDLLVLDTESRRAQNRRTHEAYNLYTPLLAYCVAISMTPMGRYKWP
jgi:hypothetical protein